MNQTAGGKSSRIMKTIGSAKNMDDLNKLLSDALTDDEMLEDLDFINDLLKRGADPNIYVDGETPLAIAIGRGNSALLKVLLENGAIATEIALIQAAMHNLPEIASLLIDAGAKVVPADEGSALHEAVRHRNHDMLRLLLESPGGAECIDCFDDVCRTPLMHAVANEDHSTAHLLINSGAHVNAIDTRRAGVTALNYAVDQKNYEMVVTLLRAGADPLLCSPGRPCAWDVAKRFEREPHVKIKFAMLAHEPDRLKRS